jgi:acylphosphatase
VRGRTQGVGFRAFVRDRARPLGLTGLARNLSDGVTVEVIAEGARPPLETLLEALNQGPRLSRVERVEASWREATGQYEGFVTG